MADTPHFALPFRFSRGRAVVNDQASMEDYASQVEAVLVTQPGERDALPGFGTPDPVLTQAPVDTQALVSAVARWVPGVRVLAEEAPDALDESIRRVRMTLDSRED